MQERFARVFTKSDNEKNVVLCFVCMRRGAFCESGKLCFYFCEKVLTSLHKIEIKQLESHGLLLRCLRLENGSCIGCQWRNRKLSDFIKNIFISIRVLKMNEWLMGLEWHGILGELSL